MTPRTPDPGKPAAWMETGPSFAPKEFEGRTMHSRRKAAAGGQQPSSSL